MKDITLGFAMCGSFCTLDRILAHLQELRAEFPQIIPILSENTFWTDSRFGSAASFIEQIEKICGRRVLKTLSEVEPIGPQKLLDVLVVAPCTGNTLAKLANGIADTSVTLGCKAHLRNARPIVLAVSTNDALSANAQNLGTLLARKHYYFVPFRQDSPFQKPCSLVADYEKIGNTVHAALEGIQLQPLLLAAP